MHDSHFFPALPTATYFWRLGQAGRGCGNDRHGPEGIGRDRLTPPPLAGVERPIYCPWFPRGISRLRPQYT